jgi:ABC-type glycerol-3-phosphate transport system substrate-binding protein
MEDLVKKIVLLVGAALALAACSESPTAPASGRLAPGARSSHDLVCRSGYIVAYDENGNPYCTPVIEGQASVKAAPKS